MSATSDRSARISDEQRRRRAEDLTAASPLHEPATPEDAARLLHELRVHQIELEMQNEELRRIQVELDESRAAYVDLFDLAPVGYVTLSERSVVRKANLTAAHLLGVARGELVGARFTGFIEPADQDTFYLHQRRPWVPGKPLACDVRLRRGDATKPGDAPLWVRLESRLQAAPGEAPLLWLTFTDVTERHLAEETVHDSEARFRGYFEQSLVGVAVTSPQKGWIEVNQATCDLLGYSPEELVHLTWAELTHPDDLAADVAQFNRVMAGEIDGYRLEKRFVHKHGVVVDVDLSVHCERDGEGHVRYLLALLSDVTARRRAEREIARLNADLEARVVERTRELTRANAELEEFVYSITHDLRSPLRALAGFSEILQMDYDDALDATGLDYLTRIHAAALHLGDVMDALLALSRVNRAELLVRDVDLSAAAREVAGQLSEADPSRVVEFDIEDGLVVSADAALCDVLLRNLLGNAWKFTGARTPARITVAAVAVDGRRVFRIGDNGAGFDQQYAGRLFQPFERLHTVDEFPGTGIGLATVKRIVTRFGGECWATGEVGQGASVFFTLPDPAAA